jgi:hypothetical protein
VPRSTTRELAQLDALLIGGAGVAHALHALDVPDALCKERLHRFRESAFDLFTDYSSRRDENVDIVID